MTYQVLARKWRPRSFLDVVGQDHVVRSLQNSLVKERVGHAYLFTGTRGTGKTTVARLLSKSLKCLSPLTGYDPCLKCEECLSVEEGHSMDVMEIDGASHNGVENVRLLIENVHYLPAKGKFKIYIIDEVHMLSTSAFNALLKVLEEPPKHVVFIFATTEPDRVLDTVLSRVQRFDFRHVPTEKVMTHLQKVAKAEGITFESPHLLRQLAIEARGSLRDALSVLDQVLSYCEDNQITEEAMVSSLGLVRTSAVKELVLAIINANTTKCSQVYNAILSENVSPEKLALGLTDYLYEIVCSLDQPQKIYEQGLLPADVLKKLTLAEAYWLFEVLAKDLNWTTKSFCPEKTTEVALLKLCQRRSFYKPGKSERTVNKAPVEESTPTPQEENNQKSTFVPADTTETPVASEQTSKSSEVCENTINEQSEKTWEGFLGDLFKKSPALAANLEQGNVLGEIDPKQPVLSINLGFTQSGKVFLEYLKDPDVFSRLLSNLTLYFDRAAENLKFTLVLVDEATQKEVNFVSRAELEEQKIKEALRLREEELLNDPVVQEASRLFSSKVDKIILNENL